MKFLRIKPLAILLLLITFFTACEKEYSYEGGAPVSVGTNTGTASFTFTNTNGNCTNAVINGTYTQNTPLNSSNSVVISVNVTTAGTYTINTATINGITFSATGNFANTGSQTIRLIGSGIPSGAGANTFIAGATGCSFSILTTAASGGGTGGGGGTNPTTFITCKIDGVSKAFNTNITGTNAAIIGLNISGDIDATSSPASISISALNTAGSVAPGTYGPISLSNIIRIGGGTFDDGVTATGWSEPLIAGANPFTVVISSLSATSVEGTFSGNLYSEDGLGTNVKTVTEGAFKVNF
jgi:hypothetical protein